MALSDHECRELDGIESGLRRTDPSLAERLRTMRGGSGWLTGSWDRFAGVVLAVVLMLALAAAAVTGDPAASESPAREDSAASTTCTLDSPATAVGAGNDVSAARCSVP